MDIEKLNKKLKDVHYRAFAMDMNDYIGIYLEFKSIEAFISILRYYPYTGKFEIADELIYFNFDFRHIKEIMKVIKYIEITGS